jgi:manganese efflux pump family protein
MLTILAFVVPLGFDTLAIAIALGLRRVDPLRPAVTFAIFEMVMPLVGIFLGYLVGGRFETPAVVLGGIVLIGVAAYIFKEALEAEDESKALSFDSVRAAAVAGFGISMDELAIGFPMGASGLPLVATLTAIGLQAFLVTVLGIVVGRRLGGYFGHRTSRAARFIAAGAFALLGLSLVAEVTR